MSSAEPQRAGPSAWTADAVARFAAAVGAQPGVDAYGPALRVGGSRLPDGPAVAPLADVGLLTLAGDDAARFLHTQITNDVEHLRPGEARWGGYCTAKGRLQSTFRYWRDPGSGSVWLTVARPLASTLARRLAMFVLRAKARVADASDACAIFGLLDAPVAAAAAHAFGIAVPAADGSAVTEGGAHLVGLPPLPGAAARPRWLLVVPEADAARAWAVLRSAAEPLDAPAWRRTEVLGGIPRIVAGTWEQFVPQMLNFESVDGVNFRKGCYPGQEVVARSQYLGKLKRRMFAAHGDGPEPEPGSDVVPAAGGEPSGQVVLAAPDGDGGFDLLFESQVAAVEAGTLLAGGVPLQVRPLPYALKAID